MMLLPNKKYENFMECGGNGKEVFQFRNRSNSSSIPNYFFYKFLFRALDVTVLKNLNSFCKNVKF